MIEHSLMFRANVFEVASVRLLIYCALDVLIVYLITQLASKESETINITSMERRALPESCLENLG